MKLRAFDLDQAEVTKVCGRRVRNVARMLALCPTLIFEVVQKRYARCLRCVFRVVVVRTQGGAGPEFNRSICAEIGVIYGCRFRKF